MMTLTWWHHVVWFCTLSHRCILPATCFEDLPTFICPSELSVSWLHLQLGLANKVICTGTGGHYRRIVASRKDTTFCHRLEGQSKAKHFPAPDEQPKFEEFECKQATCHCCKEAVDAFPCCRFHVFFLLDFRKVYMQSSTVYRSRKLGSLSSVIKINI